MSDTQLQPAPTHPPEPAAHPVLDCGKYGPYTFLADGTITHYRKELTFMREYGEQMVEYEGEGTWTVVDGAVVVTWTKPWTGGMLTEQIFPLSGRKPDVANWR